MNIEAHLVERGNLFAAASKAFEELVQELSEGESQNKTHNEQENLISHRILTGTNSDFRGVDYESGREHPSDEE